jgi:hypothetical protein
MTVSQLLGLAGNLIGIGPLTWAIRRVAARHVRAPSPKLPAETSNIVTIEIHSVGPQHVTSITASVTFLAVPAERGGKQHEPARLATTPAPSLSP